MPGPKRKRFSRRNFIKLAAGAAAVGPFFVFRPNAFASEMTLKVAKWAHFLPEFDDWFINVMAAEWGKRNKTKVTVDVIPVEEIRERAFAEVTAEHDKEQWNGQRSDDNAREPDCDGTRCNSEHRQHMVPKIMDDVE